MHLISLLQVFILAIALSVTPISAYLPTRLCPSSKMGGPHVLARAAPQLASAPRHRRPADRGSWRRLLRARLVRRNANPLLCRSCPLAPARGRSFATSSQSTTRCCYSTMTMTRASLTSRCSSCTVAAVVVEGKPKGRGGDNGWACWW